MNVRPAWLRTRAILRIVLVLPALTVCSCIQYFPAKVPEFPKVSESASGLQRVLVLPVWRKTNNDGSIKIWEVSTPTIGRESDLRSGFKLLNVPTSVARVDLFDQRSIKHFHLMSMTLIYSDGRIVWLDGYDGELRVARTGHVTALLKREFLEGLEKAEFVNGPLAVEAEHVVYVPPQFVKHESPYCNSVRHIQHRSLEPNERAALTECDRLTIRCVWHEAEARGAREFIASIQFAPE